MRKIYKSCLLSTLGFFAPFFVKAQINGGQPIFLQEELKLISSGFRFTEGCSSDKNGDVFFTDQPNDKIWKYNATNGKLSVFLNKSGRSNGTYFDKKGNLITCADDQGELWSVSPSGEVKVIFRSKPGKQLNGPNDIWIHPNGGMYFTDPYYKRDYWTRTAPDLKTEDVYYLPKGGDTAKVVASGMVKPNGIVGTPDGKNVYVSDLQAGKTYRFNREKNGDLSNKSLIINKGSDGMTLDDKGRIYLTAAGGVFIYHPDGKLIDQIKMTENPTNVCFFGKNKDMLFITTPKSVYALKMQSRGVE